MDYELQTALERTVAHLHEKGIPEHLAEAVKVLDERLAEKQREQKIKADLVAATAEHWQQHMRDRKGRRIPVDHELIEYAAGVVLDTTEKPPKATAEDVIDEAVVLRWGDEEDNYKGYRKHKRAVIRRQLEGLEAICRVENHARALVSTKPTKTPVEAESSTGVQMAAQARKTPANRERGEGQDEQ